MSHPASAGINGRGGKTEMIQPAQATASPPAQIVPHVANPAATAVTIALTWVKTKFTMEIIHSVVSPPPVVSSVAVAVVPVLVLADAGGISCMTNRPATRARTKSFCACVFIMESLQLLVLL